MAWSVAPASNLRPLSSIGLIKQQSSTHFPHVLANKCTRPQTVKHSWVEVKEVMFSGRFQAAEVSDFRVGREVWSDFQLPANKLHFTFQLLSVPLDSRQGREQGPQGGIQGAGGGVWCWCRGLCLVGVTGRVGARSRADRPWKFPLYVSALFRMGGVWSFLGGGGEGVGGWVGGGWVGVWRLGCEPAPAGSLLVSHGQKKQSWTLPGYLSAALQLSPKQTGTPE